ncbi:MAG: oligoendopeptidase F [Clostridiales bacterium]|nr:oligoendopeptidase F [Clostridiales bacterium]
MKKRNEMDKQYQWDLSSLYATDELWEEDFLKATSMLDEIEKYSGHVVESAEILYQITKLEMSLDRLIHNLFAYAQMRKDEDTNISKYQSMATRAERLSVKISSAVSFINPEILSHNQELILAYVEEKKELRLYKKYFQDILRRKPHMLGEKEEKLLANTMEMASTPYNIFGMLNNADFKFPTIKDSRNEDFTLSHGNFIPTLESSDRELRERAFKAFYSVYDNHKNALGMILQSEVKKNVFYAQAKNFDSAIEAALFENNIPLNVYENLIDSVNKALPDFYRYMSLRKKVLKLDNLHMYDIYTPIVEEVEFNISYEESQKTVLDALSVLGEDYVSVVENAFNTKWIDVYENEGKRSGAYSFGTYDSNPFILLNYYNTMDNMYTLAHEMGHSMHSYFAHQNQEYVYGNYSIFVAEVASTCNEALLNDYLLKTTLDSNKKLYILNHYLEMFRTTLFRQTMFAEFELLIHKKHENGEALTTEVLKKEYKVLNEKYYGADVVIDDEISLEWSRIPHFYYNFYVFQYATGFSTAIALANQILNEGESAVKRYKGFLSAGSSKDPIDVLKDAGADISTGQPVTEALELFGRLVRQMEELLSEK